MSIARTSILAALTSESGQPRKVLRQYGWPHSDRWGYSPGRRAPIQAFDNRDVDRLFIEGGRTPMAPLPFSKMRLAVQRTTAPKSHSIDRPCGPIPSSNCWTARPRNRRPIWRFTFMSRKPAAERLRPY
jgi:hypothetical protein